MGSHAIKLGSVLVCVLSIIFSLGNTGCDKTAAATALPSSASAQSSGGSSNASGLSSSNPSAGSVSVANSLEAVSGIFPGASLVQGSDLAIWANDGEDKVAREEMRVSTRGSDRATALTSVANSVFDGQRILLKAAKNETVNFNLVIESPLRRAEQMTVRFDRLVGPGGAQILTRTAHGNGVFDYRNRPIELFYVQYLPIRGLSAMSYDFYDERHIPARFRGPFNASRGFRGTGTWNDRPDHDKNYPEIAVPLEQQPRFSIEAGQNQSIWADVYVPKTSATGLYQGQVAVLSGNTVVATIPVELQVRNFTLSDEPAAKTMLYLGFSDINRRYLGFDQGRAITGAQQQMSKLIRDRHFQMAHRHRISLIDDDSGFDEWNEDRPRPEWTSRLNGTLFTPAHGYEGPGEAMGNGVYSIGNYGNWTWKNEGAAGMQRHTDAWEQWFLTNAPQTERFLYLIDESSDFSQIDQWAQWIRSGTGVGRNLNSFVTMDALAGFTQTPNLSLFAHRFQVGDTQRWTQMLEAMRRTSGNARRLMMYNGYRPGTGSFATEDDGVALRELVWSQVKLGIHRWYFWESTYYYDFQGGRTRHNNVWEDARTFGADGTFDNRIGMSGNNYSNGDGVLFYPGTDTVYPHQSKGLMGPVASLRLKHWRRGIQDAEYLRLAKTRNAQQVQRIIDRMVPKALWEYGVTEQADPTYVVTDVSWSNVADHWEAAREELANIIGR